MSDNRARHLTSPRYIDPTHTDEYQIPPPYKFSRWRSALFLVRVAEEERLKKLVDHFLNIAPEDDLRFRPLSADDPSNSWYRSKTVFLQINDYPDIRSEVPPFSEQGFITAKEVVFSFLVQSFRNSVPTGKFFQFIPFIFIDQPWSVVSARDIFGFPKQQSDFRFVPDLRNPRQITAETLVYRTFGRATPQTHETFLNITQSPNPEQADLENPALQPSNFASDLQQLLKVPFVKLRQFREPEHPETAACQAIVRSALDLSLPREIRPLPGPFTATLSRFDSLPIAEQLGLATSDNESLELVDIVRGTQAISFRLNATLGLGKILFPPTTS